jgi:hypothetical protein
MTRSPLTTEVEFQQLMGEVDRQLQSEMVPIPSRPMRAESLLARRLGEQFVRPYLRREPTEGRYTGDDLTIRVSRWFRARYGDRLKMSFGPGRMVIIVLGDPWLVQFPMLYGTWEPFLSATEHSAPEGPHVRRAREAFVPLRYNIADSFIDLPLAVVGQLSAPESSKLLETWRNGWLALMTVGEVQQRHQLVRLALADLDTTVDHLTGQRGDVGLARWAALQAVEKMLKAYIGLCKVFYKHSHELAKLAADAESLGLPLIDRRWLAYVQCSAGVRYGTEKTDIETAVTAHHASIGIAAHVARSIRDLPAAEAQSR